MQMVGRGRDVVRVARHIRFGRAGLVGLSRLRVRWDSVVTGLASTHIFIHLPI